MLPARAHVLMAPSAHLKCGSQPGSPSRTASLCWCISYSAQHVNCGKERKLLKETIHSSPCERGSNYRVSSRRVFLHRPCLCGWFVGCVCLRNASPVCQAWNRQAGALPRPVSPADPARPGGLRARCTPTPGPASGHGRWDHRLQRNPSEADPSLEALLLSPYLSERIGPDHSLMISPVLSASFSAAGSAWGGQGINIA